MAETLGTLCDKLTVVKLKQWHVDTSIKLDSLAQQENQLIEEIDEFVVSAFNGDVPAERLVFVANKIFKKEGNPVDKVLGSIGNIVSQLAEVNCGIWHEQEKVYEFEKVLPEDKDKVIKELAILNLKRNKCMEAIDKELTGSLLINNK